jgi:hypothetical protein
MTAKRRLQPSRERKRQPFVEGAANRSYLPKTDAVHCAGEALGASCFTWRYWRQRHIVVREQKLAEPSFFVWNARALVAFSLA